MLIKDLIKKLQEYDPEGNIRVSDGADYGGGFYDNVMIKRPGEFDSENYYLMGDF